MYSIVGTPIDTVSAVLVVAADALITHRHLGGSSARTLEESEEECGGSPTGAEHQFSIVVVSRGSGLSQ